MNIIDIVDQANYLEMAKALIEEYWRPSIWAEMKPEARAFRKTQYNWAWGVLDANRGKPRPHITAHEEYLVGFDGGPPPRKEDGESKAPNKSGRAGKSLEPTEAQKRAQRGRTRRRRRR